MPCSPSPTRRLPPRAFTLLELLLATTVIASMSVLLGALWSQARSWTTNSAHVEAAMRLPRVLELTHAQWAERRTILPVTSRDSGVRVEPDRIEFITAQPILFPDWPLVRATYRIERPLDLAPGRPPAFDLVYEERRLADVNPRPDPNAAQDGAPAPLTPPTWLDAGAHRLILLRGCSDLRLERFGRPVAPQSDSAPGGSTDSSSLNPDDRTADLWRPIEPGYSGPLVAVRFTGIFQQEAFACILAIEGSRSSSY